MADIERIKGLSDPVERAIEVGRVLNALPAISAELRAMRQAAVNELQERGWSLAQIAKALDLHRNRVQHIAQGGPPGTEKPPATPPR